MRRDSGHAFFDASPVRVVDVFSVKKCKALLFIGLLSARASPVALPTAYNIAQICVNLTSSYYPAMRSVSILGSTGSIGCNTLKVIDHLGDFRVVAMAAGRNIEKFAAQVAKYRPQLASCYDESCAEELERELSGLGVAVPRIEIGEAGLIAVATHHEADTVVAATVAGAGIAVGAPPVPR